jgi:hypothetical protein
METQEQRTYSSYSFTNSAVVGGEWSASRPGRALPPWKKNTDTHWTGGWAGPRAGLDTDITEKFLLSLLGIELPSLCISSVVRRYTD